MIMTHLYSEKQLARKTRNQLWAVCDQLGVKRRRSKADCISQILAVQPQQQPKQEMAIISYDDDELTRPYYISSNGVVIHRTDTYAQAERFCALQGYKLSDPVEQAQLELDDYLFHEQPRSTEAGTLPCVANDYFDLSSEVASLAGAFDKIVSHGQVVMRVAEGVDFKDEWRQKLIQASELVTDVMASLYHEGLLESDRIFLSKCM